MLRLLQLLIRLEWPLRLLNLASALLERFPRLAGDTSRLEWKRSIVLRGPLHLPVRTRG
ncbi:MAG: hypothetical protein V3V67_07760 [Myxococcota bacterium]